MAVTDAPAIVTSRLNHADSYTLARLLGHRRVRRAAQGADHDP